MDVAAEFPLRVVNTKNTPCVDGDAQWHSPTSIAAAPYAVSKVLDDDNLLREIIVHVGFLTTLVRAALVCKRWYHHASDPAFLRRFLKLHPPHLLGFYVVVVEHDLSIPLTSPRFVPMLPQPPELAAVVRHVAGYSFRAYDDGLWIKDCRNGSVFTRRREGRELAHGVHHPLCPKRGMPFIPPLPHFQDRHAHILSAILSKEEGDDLSYFYLLLELAKETQKFMVRVYMLQDGVWCMHTSDTYQIHPRRLQLKPVLVDNKIYMAPSLSGDIVVLDLTTSSFSTIQLPQGVEFHYFNTMFSRADDASSVYLIHVHAKKLQLHIWLHKGDNWLLVDAICSREMRAILGMSDHTVDDEALLLIKHVGDCAEFVFLEMGRCAFHLDIKCRQLHKVYELLEKSQCISYIHPFMMIWPPTFPALRRS